MTPADHDPARRPTVPSRGASKDRDPGAVGRQTTDTASLRAAGELEAVRWSALLALARFGELARRRGDDDVVTDGVVHDVLLAVDHDDLTDLYLAAVRREDGSPRRAMSWHALVGSRGFVLLSRRHEPPAGREKVDLVVGVGFGGRAADYAADLAIDWPTRTEALDDHRVLGRVADGPGRSLTLVTADGAADVLWRPTRHLGLRPGDWVTAAVAGPPATAFEIRAVVPT